MFVAVVCCFAGGRLFSPDPDHSVASYGGLESFRRGKGARTNTQHVLH